MGESFHEILKNGGLLAFLFAVLAWGFKYLVPIIGAYLKVAATRPSTEKQLLDTASKQLQDYYERSKDAWKLQQELTEKLHEAQIQIAKLSYQLEQAHKQIAGLIDKINELEGKSDE